MRRLIDANALKDIIQEVISEGERENLYTKILSHFGYVLDSCPTVDAVEVVRCKDCRWRKGRSLCYMISGDGIGVGTGDDFFCAYGVAAKWKEKDNGL